MIRKWTAITVLVALITSFLPLVTFAGSADMTSYTPYEVTTTPLPVDETHPYGSVDLKFKINNLPRGTSDAPWAVEIQKKIGDTDWTGVSFVKSDTYLDENSLGNNTYHFEQLWNESTAWSTDIQISYRVRVNQCDSTFSAVASSPWSNMGNNTIKASAWAVQDIGRAATYGLVPDSIKGDYTQPISRQEFAELAVKLYEVYSKKSADAVSPNPFTDCTNTEVLKAFNLQIVNGVSATQFKPSDLTNREQIAAMLYRAVKAIAPTADMSTVGSPAFSDGNAIAPYFLENVKFMSKNNFIKGSNGNFEPKGTCTREMAVLIAVRVYEKYAGITQ